MFGWSNVAAGRVFYILTVEGKNEGFSLTFYMPKVGKQNGGRVYYYLRVLIRSMWN